MSSKPALASGFVTDRMVRDLQDSIASGTLAPGSRILSEVDLAARYRISVISVRRGLKQLTDMGWLTRMKGKGTFVRSVGEQRRSGQTSSLTIVQYSPMLLDKSARPYMWFLPQRTVQGIVQAAESRGLDVSVKYLTSGVDPGIYDRYPFESISGDALIFMYFDVTPASVERLAKERRPVILIDPTESISNFTSIVHDLSAGIYESVRHLASMGHRKIAWLGGDPGSEWKPHSVTRQSYFVEGMARAGLEARPEFLINGGPDSSSARKAMQKLLASNSRPTAVIAMNDDRALGAADAIRDAGLRIPDDIALVGFDDAPFAESFEPPLTTIRAARLESGMEAVNLAVQALSGAAPGPLVKRLPPELIVRASCGWKPATETAVAASHKTQTEVIS